MEPARVRNASPGVLVTPSASTGSSPWELPGRGTSSSGWTSRQDHHDRLLHLLGHRGGTLKRRAGNDRGSGSPRSGWSSGPSGDRLANVWPARCPAPDGAVTRPTPRPRPPAANLPAPSRSRSRAERHGRSSARPSRRWFQPSRDRPRLRPHDSKECSSITATSGSTKSLYAAIQGGQLRRSENRAPDLRGRTAPKPSPRGHCSHRSRSPRPRPWPRPRPGRRTKPPRPIARPPRR